MRILNLKLCFRVILAGVILCGCGEPDYLNLYDKYYTPAMSEKEVKALKSSGDYPKEMIAKTNLSSAQIRKFDNALINFYKCAYIGGSDFETNNRYIQIDRKDPERLAQKVGANYYITYKQWSDASKTTTAGADTKVATQGGMGRGITGAITTTTSQDAQLQIGALFYLCD